MPAMRLIVSEETLSRDTLEVVIERFDAVHNAWFFSAVDGLFAADTLLGMLDQGIAFHRSLELIVSQVVPTTKTLTRSKRRPELTQPYQSEEAIQQSVVTPTI
jgi:hypothetical protein